MKNIYGCPMHPEVTSDFPGECPKCHMKLEKTSQIHDHRHHDNHAGHNTNVFKQKFWVSLLLTIPVLALSHTIQGFLNIDISIPYSSFISMTLGLIIFYYGGLVFLRSAKNEITSKRLGMMTLVAIAIGVALIYSILATIGIVDGMDFWWELSTLITIMLLGHWLEMSSISKAQGSLNSLAKLIPDQSEIVESDKPRIIPTVELKLGDKVIIRPGAQIPVDGRIIEGESDINEAMLTGESMPVRRTVGMKVIGGTINTTGRLIVEIDNVGDNTVLAGIMKLIQDAQSSRSATQLLADRVASYLVYISISVAILTAIGWWAVGGSLWFILERVVTVLIVACPHALGLAIPLVVAISTTKGLESGLLVRNRMALESARSIDTVLFDKTGTLTNGEQSVHEVISDNLKHTLSLAVSLESQSEHPIAKAIVKYASDMDITGVNITKFSSLPGRGVKAYAGRKLIYAGNRRLLSEIGVKLNKQWQAISETISKDKRTIIYVVENQILIGAISISDTIREESKEAVATLRNQGNQVMMVTGDNEGVASQVSKEIGIDKYFSEVLPKDKVKIIKKMQSNGSRIAMVGDGINDAPALAQADIGIAIGAGTDIAIESADIILTGSDPRGVAKVINLSKATYKKMSQNLFWATGYNVVVIPLATGITSSFGFVLSPALGAVLMSLSTIIVAINAQLLRRVNI